MSLLPLALLPLIAQAGAPAGINDTRFQQCIEQARTDPTSAIVTASTWLGEVSVPSDRAFPHECLGIAYTRLLRWQAAEESFLAGRNAAWVENYALRARLAAMAGNAALAESRFAAALADFELAQIDAAAGGNVTVSGEIEIDRARALVGLGRSDEAALALATARRDAPQNSDAWLLSATLARRGGDLASAQGWIETAGALDPRNPEIALEAGVIAVLAGNDEAARKSWQSALELAPDGPEAETARNYLAQIAGEDTTAP